MNEQGWLPLVVMLLCACSFGLFLYSYANSLRQLAKRYRTAQPVTGKTWRFQRYSIGEAFPRTRLTVTSNEYGLFLQHEGYFRLFRDILFIPWDDFHNAQLNHDFNWPNVRAEVGTPPIAVMRFPAEIFAQGEGYRVLT